MNIVLWIISRYILIIFFLPFVLMIDPTVDIFIAEALKSLPETLLNWLLKASEAILAITFVNFAIWATVDRSFRLSDQIKPVLIRYGWIIFFYPFVKKNIFPQMEGLVFDWIENYVIGSVPLLMTVTIVWLVIAIITFAHRRKNMADHGGHGFRIPNPLKKRNPEM